MLRLYVILFGGLLLVYSLSGIFWSPWPELGEGKLFLASRALWLTSLGFLPFMFPWCFEP